MTHQSVENDPATLCVLVNVKKLLTLASKLQDVPPNTMSIPEFAVAATPPDWNRPLPMIVELPPGAAIVRTTQVDRRYHEPDRDETGVVCVIDVPSVVPGADVPRPGEMIN